MRLGVYTQASTANPTGRRPWNSRLSYYVPNSFNLPTLGQGPWLLQPGVTGMPMQAGGVPTIPLGCDGCSSGLAGFGGKTFPNSATFERARMSRRRFDSTAPMPFYLPPPTVTNQLSTVGPNPLLSGLGQTTQILGLTVDPTLLALGLGVAFLAIYLIGGGRPKRKRHRLQRKISRAQAQLRTIEAV